MPLIIDEPLGNINTAEAAALTIIRGVSPNERQEALEWFRKRAKQRDLSDAVIRAIAKFIEDDQTANVTKKTPKKAVKKLVKQNPKDVDKSPATVAKAKKVSPVGKKAAKKSVQAKPVKKNAAGKK